MAIGRIGNGTALALILACAIAVPPAWGDTLIVAAPEAVAGEELLTIELPDLIASAGAANAQARPRTTARTPAQAAAARSATRPATRRVCTTSRVNGRSVRRCRNVAVRPAVPPRAPLPAAVLNPPSAPLPAPAVIAPPPLPEKPRAVLTGTQSVQRAQPVAAIESYRWIDEADGFAQAIGNAPPDYAFRYEGHESWAWVSRAGETLIVEPGDDGLVQYYYAPLATAPYLVRDAYYSYAYEGPELAQVYANDGQVWTQAISRRQLNDADMLQTRGRRIISASWRARQWDNVTARNWSQQTSIGFGFGAGWSGDWGFGWNDSWRRRDDWSRYYQQHREREARRGLDNEHRARRDSSQQFADWRARGGRGEPPHRDGAVAPGGGGAGTSFGGLTGAGASSGISSGGRPGGRDGQSRGPGGPNSGAVNGVVNGAAVAGAQGLNPDAGNAPVRGRPGGNAMAGAQPGQSAPTSAEAAAIAAVAAGAAGAINQRRADTQQREMADREADLARQADVARRERAAAIAEEARIADMARSNAAEANLAAQAQAQAEAQAQAQAQAQADAQAAADQRRAEAAARAAEDAAARAADAAARAAADAAARAAEAAAAREERSEPVRENERPD